MNRPISTKPETCTERRDVDPTDISVKVINRLLRQALHQVISPIFDADFSESSYGFRPGRNAHQAVKAAKQYVAEGRRVVVDIDLEKFFDRVNHDSLREKLSKKINGKGLVSLLDTTQRLQRIS